MSDTEQRVLAMVQARMSSTRLPGKVLASVLGRPMILRQLERVERAASLMDVVVATSVEESDNALAEVLAKEGVAFHRGPLQDVLARFVEAVEAYEAENGGVDHVVRLTADCPLIDPGVVDRIVARHLETGAEYTSNVIDRSYPDGLDAEAMTRATLARLDQEGASPMEREHVTYGVALRRADFRVEQVVMEPDLADYRWTVDTPEDLEFARKVYAALYPRKPDFDMQDILDLGPAFERRV